MLAARHGVSVNRGVRVLCGVDVEQVVVGHDAGGHNVVTPVVG